MSFLMKIGFNLVSKNNDLWVCVLYLKYSWKEQLPEFITRSQCSHLWRSLSKIWSLLRKNLAWSIGDGTSIHHWKDSWVPAISHLLSQIPSFANLDLDCFVRELVNSNGKGRGLVIVTLALYTGMTSRIWCMYSEIIGSERCVDVCASKSTLTKNVSWLVIEVVKVSISWARQLELHLSRCKNNTHSSGYVTNTNGTWVHLLTNGVVAGDTGNAAARGVV
ncbi:hypothetical protein J1N35_011022 [Gossypium stocksii]|uniref:Reverse transcriptase zinc-binding domain-containing protein n=1 Tax=Gossypium stocksii TaxID=47602 RepID=A0A9D3W1Q5_9ROSI|nr:hypothetical protein J1N35_011022 [Gossypium stocksii]